MILFIRNLVVKDLWLKLFSLALAVLIWFTVYFSLSKDVSPWAALIGRTADESLVTVPVSVPPGTHGASVRPDAVQVTLRGDPKLLQRLRMGDDVRAQVNLAGIQSADGLRCPVDLILPQGVSYTHIKPDEVEVRLSPKTQ
jgi:hypothetical protein